MQADADGFPAQPVRITRRRVAASTVTAVTASKHSASSPRRAGARRGCPTGPVQRRLGPAQLRYSGPRPLYRMGTSGLPQWRAPIRRCASPLGLLHSTAGRYRPMPWLWAPTVRSRRGRPHRSTATGPTHATAEISEQDAMERRVTFSLLGRIGTTARPLKAAPRSGGVNRKIVG